MELTLDPSKFSEGQRKALDDLRRMGQQADTTIRGIDTGGGNRLRRFFESFSPPINTATQNLGDLSSQSRRTGAAVAAGAIVGQIGLKNLAIAGVEAYAALKSIQAVIGEVTTATQRGAALSRASWMIGLPGGVRTLDTLIQAAQEIAHVPQETTIGLLNSYQQRITEQQRTGQWAPEFTEASRLGVNFSAPILDQIKQIRAALRGMTGPQAESWVNALGLGPLLNYLKLSQELADAAERRAGQHALTAGQAEEMARLQTNATRLENSLVHLWETIATKFSKSGFRDALEGWSLFIDALTAGEERTKAQDAALNEIGNDIQSLAEKLMKLTFGTILAGFLPALAGLLAGFWPSSGGGAPDERNFPGMNNPFAPMPPDTRNWWQQHAPSWLGGRPPATVPGPAVAGGNVPYDAIDAALAPIIQRESHGSAYVGYTPPGQPLVDLSNAKLDDTGFPIWRGNMGPAGLSTAAGLYQIVGRAWRPIARELGIHDFSPESQRRVARELYRRYGLTPWKASATQTAAVGTRSPFPTGTKFNSQGQAYNVDMTPAEAANVQASMAAIRASKGHWADRSVGVNDVDINGDIHIHTAATDAPGISLALGGALRQEISRNKLISSANSGLS